MMNPFNPIILLPVTVDVVLVYILYLLVMEVRFDEISRKNNKSMERKS